MLPIITIVADVSVDEENEVSDTITKFVRHGGAQEAFSVAGMPGDFDPSSYLGNR